MLKTSVGIKINKNVTIPIPTQDNVLFYQGK